jgi:hypothetical protein
MLRFWTSLPLMCATALTTYSASSYADSAVGSADEVIQWNKPAKSSAAQWPTLSSTTF